MLYIEIEQKRLQMLKFAKKYGMTAEATVQCSQELDKLLNLLQLPSTKKRKIL
ncbi:aspartyl-phosphate phosphatase Spo0E family protein [Halalkalibacter alkalisediminis]|uniref:Aspartyl-phosphate phosphatase Spo0E family protein n=1 Tax=Halalkalibacter alkalisediminis TaxID=935616 RepID=A0ABV6NH09_9BACI|nr:aspartyl-phosphate phosphatase Spo0E family protein [Halalkalibacter alkalisediminis]